MRQAPIGPSFKRGTRPELMSACLEQRRKADMPVGQGWAINGRHSAIEPLPKSGNHLTLRTLIGGNVVIFRNQRSHFCSTALAGHLSTFALAGN
jgi:hypothetical protein